MNYLKFTIIGLILATILICFFKPHIPKRVIIGDANVVVVPENQNIQGDVSIKDNSGSKIKKVVNQPRHLKVVEGPKKFSDFAKTSKSKSLVSIKEQNKDLLQKNNKVSVPKQINQQNMQVRPKQVVSKTATRQLTPEEEEIIAWNAWRSALQNKVMRDTKLPAPIGTAFKFSFTVDREGTISNLKVWSTNSAYTPLAVRTIKPTILGYQGQSILNFPPKSKRVITNVDGGFTIWYSSGYSSPSDYSDYERVKQ